MKPAHSISKIGASVIIPSSFPLGSVLLASTNNNWPKQSIYYYFTTCFGSLKTLLNEHIYKNSLWLSDFCRKKWASTLLNADIKPYVQFEASFINLELLELQANVTEIKQSTCNKGISIVCALRLFFLPLQRIEIGTMVRSCICKTDFMNFCNTSRTCKYDVSFHTGKDGTKIVHFYSGAARMYCFKLPYTFLDMDCWEVLWDINNVWLLLTISIPGETIL